MHVLQTNGLNCVSGQHLVHDSTLSESVMHGDVLEFIGENLASIDKVIDICT